MRYLLLPRSNSKRNSRIFVKSRSSISIAHLAASCVEMSEREKIKQVILKEINLYMRKSK